MLGNFRVVFDPNKKIAYRDEVLIGLGDTQIGNEGLVLQHKTEPKHYLSLSDYLHKSNIPNFAEHDDKIFIEDYSVDTVLSVWIFLQKIRQKSLPENIRVWIDYASQWEQGDTSTTGKAFESYGCLQNALALSLYDLDAKGILDKSLFFLDYLIDKKFDPSHIPNDIDISLYDRAYQSLQKEYERYRQILEQSKIEKLMVPYRGSSETREVSAIFIEAQIPTSIQKVFLRNDETNSPTKDGFALIALYNPASAGTGNDIVISVDPQKGIWLRDLWAALEQEEDRLWKGKRPNDVPRSMVSYPDNNGPNEPWWDDMGNYTLIAAPKMTGNNYGRRVSWKTVKQLIGQLYSKGANR